MLLVLASLAAAAPRAAPLDVAVLVVVDQLPVGAEELLLPALEEHVAARAVGRYPYAVTVTCAGHATLATGVEPAKHGIVANRWFVHPSDAKASECVGAGTELLRPTVAEAVREGGGWAVGVALKDRSAIPLAGARDHAVWWSTTDAAPASEDTRLRAIAEAHPVGGYLGTWVAEPRVPEALPDAQARERVDRYAQRDAVFPYAADASQPERIWVHPGAGALVVDVALDVLAQRSAETGGPGLLALSFSHTDKIGHAWTSTSREYADAVLRLGDELDRLFDALDARGLRWGAVLTGDHGGLGAPEGYLRFHADDAGAHPTDGPLASPDAFLEHRRAAQGYLSDPAVVATEAWRACGGATGAARWSFPYVWFPEGSAEVRACAKAGAARALGALRDGDVSLVAAVVDTDAGEVLTGALTADVRAAVAASTFQGRSGDLHVVLAPGVVHLDRREAPVDAGTDHGMPWDYDRNVPLLFLGDARVRAEALEAPVDLRRVAPTLGGWLGIRRPLADDVAPPLPR